MLYPLLDKITEEFPKRSRTCIKNVLILALGIITKETVCLNKIKGAVGNMMENPTTQSSSHYKRLIRVFNDFAFSSLWLELLTFVFRVLRLKSNYLLLDGTSWQRGNKRIHFLTLCILYKEVAIPIYWINLQKKGCSNFKERKEIIKKAKKRFNITGKILLADREYIGKEWFEYLVDTKIEFVIRIRKSDYKKAVNAAEGKSYEAMERKVLKSKKVGKTVGKQIVLDGMKLTIVMVKNPKSNTKDPVIYLLSNRMETPAKIAAHYPIRWKIEVCFKHLKSNGFDLQAINLKGRHKEILMMAIVVFAYVLSINEGLKRYKNVAEKEYADGTVFKEESVFRCGLNQLFSFCFNFQKFIEYILGELVTKIPKYKNPNSLIVQ